MADRRKKNREKKSEQESSSFELQKAKIVNVQMRWMMGFDLLTRIVRNGTWIAVVFIICYFGIYLPVRVSHGETTTISVFVDWLIGFKLDRALLTGAGGLGWFLYFRQKKKSNGERITRDKYTRSLELGYDPDRQSSGIDDRGDTQNE